MSSTPANIYPLSTAGEIAIPLDVARPICMVKAKAFSGASTLITLPAEGNLCSICFESDVIVTLGAVDIAYGENAYSAGVFYCKAGVIMDIYLPAQIRIRGNGADSLGYINVLETWVQMNNTGSYGVS